MFFTLEQTITYLHRRCSSELQIFILVFQKKKNFRGFLFGMKTCESKLSSQWLNLEQIWPADISPSSFWWNRFCSILNHFIINVAKRGKKNNFFKCRNDEKNTAYALTDYSLYCWFEVGSRCSKVRFRMDDPRPRPDMSGREDLT